MPAGFNNIPNTDTQVVENLLSGNLGGIFSTRASAKYVSGARCILRINSRPVGFAFGVSWRIDTEYTEIETIDNIEPEELAPKKIKVSGSISALHIPGRGPGAQLWQGDSLSFLFHQYITIEVRDSVTNQLLFFAPRAAVISRQEEIRADDMANISLNFVAIGFKDEKQPGIPTGADTLNKQSPHGDIQSEATSAHDPSSSRIPG